MEYSIAKGPGPGKKKAMKMAKKQYKADAEKAEERKEQRVQQFNNPETKKKVAETLVRNTNVPLALKTGIAPKLNEQGQYTGEQVATPQNTPQKPKVKYKMTPKFK